MSVRQEAYRWIDRLPEDSVRAVIEIMMRMVPPDARHEVSGHPTSTSAKMQAYQKMQKLRKQTARYDISVSERDAALDEKYGSIRWSGSDDL